MRNRLLIFFALLALTHFASGQWKQNPNRIFSPEEAITLVNQLLGAIQPDSPENSYMTPFMKEKIRWIYVEVAAHRLILNFMENNKNQMGPSTVFMSATYANGVRVINISANRLLELVRIQQNVTTGFNQIEKNGFALGLIHEAVHLEQPEIFFAKQRTKAEFVSEELRACRKVDQLAVTHLLAIKQPLDIDYEELHAIFKKCGSSQICPAFQEYYVDKTHIGPQ